MFREKGKVRNIIFHAGLEIPQSGKIVKDRRNGYHREEVPSGGKNFSLKETL
jgi:hypothetical protein